MAPKIKASAMHQTEVAIAQAEAPELERVNWRQDPGLRKLYFFAAIICVASATTGYDGSMLNNIRILPQWTDYFNDPQGSNLGILTALYSIGSIASLPIVPFVSDHFGRRWAIISGCFIMIIAAAIQGASQNLAMFKGGRFLMAPRKSHSNLQLSLESGSNHQYLALVWNQRIPTDWSWRIPTIVQGAPSVIQIIFIWWIPESPRWLISKDRQDEALAVLAKYHANGNAQHPTVQFEYAEIKETLRLEFIAKKSSSYLDFIKTKGNRYRFVLVVSLGLFSQWSGNGLVSYYSADIYKSIGITSSDSQLGLNGGLNIWSLIVSCTCALLCDRVGRRPLFIAATLGMLCCFIAWTICAAVYQDNGNKAAGRAVVAFIWLHGTTYSLAWSGLLVGYTVEIMPFKIRAKGLMVMNFWVQVALVINQYVNPLGFKHLQPNWKLYTIYTCWIALELVFVYFLYVETRGPTLEEIAKIFDGEEAEVAQVDIDKARLASAVEKNDTTVEHRNVV
ncbi:hypothetical protein LTR72_004950 [Exophiala xenobiotica]|nr:hypothetical protein LTR72_004950 [Exophiala xenobiotica]KAK5499859.1 hypothetical protein LTR55_000682 [Exophiala xenobiotica]